MKHKLLFMVFLFGFSLLHGQEVKLTKSAVATAGSSEKIISVGISKWRLGQVHQLKIDRPAFESLYSINWEVKSYPNPFNDYLTLDFKTSGSNKFLIQINDLSGKKILFNEERTIEGNQATRLDLSQLANAIYLLSVISEDKKTRQVIKIQKH